jgi:hypothetical protein
MGKLLRYLKDNWWKQVEGEAKWHFITELKRYLLGPWGVWNVLTFIAGIVAGTCGALQAWIYSQPTYIVVAFFVGFFASVLAIVNLLWALWNKWRQRKETTAPKTEQPLTEDAYGTFTIEMRIWELRWRPPGENEDRPFRPDDQIPNNAPLALHVTAEIKAPSDRIVEEIGLEFMGQFLPNRGGKTERLTHIDKLLRFDIPSNACSGKHEVRLTARTSRNGAGTKEEKSPPFIAVITHSYSYLQRESGTSRQKIANLESKVAEQKQELTIPPSPHFSEPEPPTSSRLTPIPSHLTVPQAMAIIDKSRRHSKEVQLKFYSTEKHMEFTKELVEIFRTAGFTLIIDEKRNEPFFLTRPTHNKIVIRFREDHSQSHLASSLLTRTLMGALGPVASYDPFPRESSSNYLQIEVGGAP